MSTTPGKDTWADAGLVPPDNAEIPTPDRGTMPVDPARQPAAPKPDLLAEAGEDERADQERDAADEALPDRLPPEAGEADALEQHLTPAGLPPQPPHLRDDAAEHDLIEQSQDVPVDDEEYPTP